MSAAPLPAPAGARRMTLSAEETAALGAALAHALEPGDVIALEGPLGAGKTRFVTGLARGIGAAERVRSPSFTLINEYRGRLVLLHADLYRVEEGEVPALGLGELGEDAVLAVEWGEKLPGRLAADALRLRFEIVSERERAITGSADAGRGAALLAAWRAIGSAE